MTQDKFKTYGNIFDNYTQRNLFKMISQGLFEGLESPISIGKEANIFSAKRKDGSTVIVKIYRLETCDFNRMYEYIRTDPRFPNLKSNKRKVIFAWAKREYVNLLKAREIGVRVPSPIAIKDNIVVMEFIGIKDPSPKLKDSSDFEVEKFAQKTFEYMKKLYKSGMVHGDLSEFNILEYKRNPVFIDFSQTTSLDDPNSNEWLLRDIKNIIRFFRKRNFEKDNDELREYITGSNNFI